MGKLTAKKVEALKEPGHYVDGDGLAPVIGKRGGKSWVLRTMAKRENGSCQIKSA